MLCSSMYICRSGLFFSITCPVLILLNQYNLIQNNKILMISYIFCEKRLFEGNYLYANHVNKSIRNQLVKVFSFIVNIVLVIRSE